MTGNELSTRNEAAGRPASKPRHNRTILVTGFGAFPGATRNPTEDIIAALGGDVRRLGRLGITLQVAVLPVRFAAIEECIGQLVEQHRPDVILHLGLASRRRHMSVETRAVNRAGPLHPDVSGQRTQQILVVGAPFVLDATYPATRILTTLRRYGVAAVRSIDSGDYVCNATLYHALLADPTAAEIGFIHVPKARTAPRPLSRVRHKSLSTTDMTRAILIAILAMAPRRTPRGRP